MNDIERRAIVSVYNKTDMVRMVRELAVRQWRIYGTQGTADKCNIDVEKPVGLLPDLVYEMDGDNSDIREMVAQKVSGLMVAEKAIQLALLNLRPPRLEIISGATVMNLDLGGISMITAAGMSGAVVLTDPETYDEALYQINRPNGVQPAFKRKRQINAHEHVMAHFTEANKLAA